MGFNNPGTVVPSLIYRDYTDWVSPDASGETGWSPVTSGTGATAAISTTSTSGANHPGQVQLVTGTTNTGRSGLTKASSNGNSLYVRPAKSAVFEAALYIPTLADGTDGFAVRLGFGLTTLANNNRPSNGVFFEYDPAASPANQNWKVIQAFSPTTGVQDTGVAPAANTWTKLRIEIGSDGLPDFYIDGVLVYDSGIAVTNNAISQFIAIYKNIGTNSRDLIVDYALYEVEFATAR